jgi:hypothetical protein
MLAMSLSLVPRIKKADLLTILQKDSKTMTDINNMEK